MCFVSVMTGSLQQQYPDPQQFPLNVWPDLSLVMAKLREIDAKLGQKDCPAPEKEAWLKAIEARLKALEEKN